MKVILELLGFVIGIILICLLIEVIFGVHIGLAEIFHRLSSEIHDFFSATGTVA